MNQDMNQKQVKILKKHPCLFMVLRYLLFMFGFMLIAFLVLTACIWFDPSSKGHVGQEIGKIALCLFLGYLINLVLAFMVCGMFCLVTKYMFPTGTPRFNPKKLIHNATPDRPRSFGRKCMWIAIKSNDTETIASVLDLREREVCNWNAGLENASLVATKGPVFLTPPVEEWSFLIGLLSLPNPEEEAEKLICLLNRLSRDFSEACYFGTMRTSDFAAWFRSKNGTMIRQFLWTGTIVCNQGELLGMEAGVDYIGKGDSDPNQEESHEERPLVPDRTTFWSDPEKWVLQISGDWSLDPSRLSQRKKRKEATGILGYLPD